MLSFRHYLFTLSLGVLIFALQPFDVMSVSGGAMIVDVCGKSPDPNRCQTCLNNDPKGKFADIKGLANISILCGKRNAYALYDKLYATINDSKNKALKDLLHKCYGYLGSTAFGIGNAGPLLQTKGIEAAKQSIRGKARENLAIVSKLFKTSGVPVPKNFIDELNGINTDCDIIMGILNRIVRR